jgi:hypothetical protein
MQKKSAPQSVCKTQCDDGTIALKLHLFFAVPSPVENRLDGTIPMILLTESGESPCYANMALDKHHAKYGTRYAYGVTIPVLCYCIQSCSTDDAGACK